MKAGKIARTLISFKKKFLKEKITNKLILTKKNELEKLYGINIEYLELRNTNNFKLTNKLQNSKIFIAFYLNKIRLIDNI